MCHSYADHVFPARHPGARTLWDEGHESGRAMVALGAAVLLTAVALDRWWGGDLGWVFDVAFVLACAWLALAVAPRDFFTVGVLPPLLMLGAFVLLAFVDPGAIARRDDSPLQAVITGLAEHAVARGAGYAVALAVLGVRQRRLAQAQTKNREASPAPSRTISG
jgi:hypothetical protein